MLDVFAVECETLLERVDYPVDDIANKLGFEEQLYLDELQPFNEPEQFEVRLEVAEIECSCHVLFDVVEHLLVLEHEIEADHDLLDIQIHECLQIREADRVLHSDVRQGGLSQ